MDSATGFRIAIVGVVLGGYFAAGPVRRYLRTNRYTRGRRRSTVRSVRREYVGDNGLRFGNIRLAPSLATNHFLFAATSGGAKTLMQRHLMSSVLLGIEEQSDSRCLILDAKNDTVPFLRKIGVTCPVYSFNPFEARDHMPNAVAWDLAADVDDPAVSLNFVSGLFPHEKGGTNQFWTDAARNGVTAVLDSFIRHTPGEFTFADFVFATLSLSRIKEVLERDVEGRENFENYFRDDDTAFKVFATIASRMAYYKPVAALWQRLPKDRRLSIRDWLSGESILILGSNARVKKALDVINELIFRVIVEEVDMQPNSNSRRTWVWIDEARLAGPLLRGDLLPQWAVKSRSKGGVLVLAFQDAGGFREACGSDKLADEICAMCSYKMLGRMESAESAKWASMLCGRYDTIEWFANENATGTRTSHGKSEQRVQKDEVLPSEFFSIPIPTKETGATAVFLGPTFAGMDMVRGKDLKHIVVSEAEEAAHGFVARPGRDQWLRGWTTDDRKRLMIDRSLSPGEPGENKGVLKTRIRNGHAKIGYGHEKKVEL